jgi:transposase
VRPCGERWAVPNEADGVVTLVDRVPPRHPPLMVVAATGGRERVATAAVATAGLPVGGVNPRQARDVARALEQLAKPEARDARALAPCADVLRPPPRPLPDAQTPERRALLGRRQPLSGLRTAAPHRRAGTSGRLAQDIAAHMAWLQARLATVDDDLETRLRASPLWRENDDLWPSVPGSGPGCARPLLRELPEWGPRTRQQIAALVGVAPRNGDRGPLRGRRLMWGGRAHVRPVLSMGTRVAPRCNPPITAFYQRLRAAGRINKVALTACRHKVLTMLNAMWKHRTFWKAQEVHN